MTPELQEKLNRYLPIRVIIRLEDNEILGLVEHSFAMDFDKSRINIFWSGKAYSMLGEHQLNGIDNAKHNLNQWKQNEMMIDPLAEDSPIEIDWEKWLAATDKFNKRNAPFKVKPHGVWQMRALVAERKYNELEPRFNSYSQMLDEEREITNKIRAILNPPEETEGEEE